MVSLAHPEKSTQDISSFMLSPFPMKAAKDEGGSSNNKNNRILPSKMNMQHPISKSWGGKRMPTERRKYKKLSSAKTPSNEALKASLSFFLVGKN